MTRWCMWLAGFLMAGMTFLQAQTVLLPERWRFTTSDSSAYRDPSYVDTGWTLVTVPAAWENEGYTAYDGFAWYRTTFEVDRKLTAKRLYLFLGKIDDADEVFLNGKRIGGTGAFPPDPVTAWNKQRIYHIPGGLLKESNLLAVRVYDMTGAGGIVSGPIGLYDEKAYQWSMHPPPGPKKSYFQPVTANGLIAAVYDEQRGLIESLRPHIFQSYDSAVTVRPVLFRIKPTLAARPTRVVYRENTHVISIAYPEQVEISYFAPFSTAEKILYAVARGPAAHIQGVSFHYEHGNAEPLIDSALFVREGGQAEKWFLFGFMDTLHHDAATVRSAKDRLLQSNGGLLDAELRWMRSMIARAKFPPGITPAERNVLEQSVAVLLMAQVAPEEIFPKARGQILASLPPGVWNISWVRDGMYSILGLNRLGMFDQARRFLEFCLNAESGRYVRAVFRDGKDYGVGVPYQVSITRYFGIGKEESDFNNDGPNIEFDDFGLFLTAFSDYVGRSGDTAFFRSNDNALSRLVADAIIHNIDSNDLMRQDSGPWERHLPGKQFANTSIVCAAGLRDFAAMCERLGIGRSAYYREASERLVSGIRKTLLVDNRLLKGNVQASDPEQYDYFDGGTFEAFAMGLMRDPALFASHYRLYKGALGMKEKGRGFSRINKGDDYEIAEWVLLDLRIASALALFGRRAEARTLIDWVTRQAALNYNLLPETYDPRTAFYTGSIPMVGFGAGAYAVALWDYYTH